LPTAGWDLIHVSQQFIDTHPDLWFNGKQKPTPGIHFASKVAQPLTDDSTTYQLIPHKWIGQIVNRSEFLGALAADLWANNTDRRQAIYSVDEKDRAIFATFIDHGNLLGGELHREQTCPRRCMMGDLSYYAGLFSRENMSEWERRIVAIDRCTIEQILAMVPEEWSTSAARQRIINSLELRKARIAGLLDEAKHIAESDISFQYHGLRTATERGFISDHSLHSRYA
jgi:hypothetical protein